MLRLKKITSLILSLMLVIAFSQVSVFATELDDSSEKVTTQQETTVDDSGDSATSEEEIILDESSDSEEEPIEDAQEPVKARGTSENEEKINSGENASEDGLSVENNTPMRALGATRSEENDSISPELIDGVYQIGTVDDLFWFAGLVNGTLDGVDQNASANAVLIDNIDLGGTNWIPIGNNTTPYSGTFNGNDKCISGLSFVRESGMQYIGLFGYVSSGGSINSVSTAGIIDVSAASSGFCVGSLVGYNAGGTIVNCSSDTDIVTNIQSVESTHDVGGLIGHNEGVVNNCSNSGNLKSLVDYKSNVGGIAGFSSTDISTCSNSGSITGKMYVGGIVGKTQANVLDSTNTGNISLSQTKGSASYACLGGIGGYVGSATNCANSGMINSNSSRGSTAVGGVAGYASSSISTCNNSATVYSYNSANSNDRNTVGGICGEYGNISSSVNTGDVTVSGASTYRDAGGIVGYSSGSKISASYNYGTIKNEERDPYNGACTGGIAAEGAAVSECYNAGLVSGNCWTGGIVGKSSSVSNCYNVGLLKSINYCGGIVGGTGNGTITSCYNIGSVSGSTKGGLIGQTSGTTVSNCYFLNRISVGAGNDSFIGTSLDIDQMKEAGSYSGFDFVDIWEMNSSDSYGLPVLKTVVNKEEQNQLSIKDSIRGRSVTGYNDSYVYTGNAIEPNVSVEGLTKGSDYSVSYNNNTNVGTAYIVITGLGEYSGTITKTFTITPADISDKSISGLKSEYEYTGSEIKPIITVEGLNEGSDFEVQYDNNIEGGTATVTVVGCGNYKGTINSQFTIYVPQDISGKEVSGIEKKYTFTGNAIEPEVDIEGLKRDVDFSVSYNNNVNAGTAQVVVTGLVHYKGTIEKSFEIDPIDISEFTVNDLMESYVHTGLAIEPNISIDGLEKNTDYVVTYADNTKIGRASLTITGINNYKGAKEEHFQIVDTDISGLTLYGADEVYEYSGKEIEPKVSITGLQKDVDYTVEYLNNVNVGTATVVVKGKGDFIGTVKKEFTIKKASISDFDVTLDKKVFVYNGNAIVPTAAIVSDSGKTLIEGTDYSIYCINNKNAGTGYLVISGQGNYKSIILQSFTINKASQTITVSTKMKSVKYSAVKKKAVATSKVSVSGAQTAYTYKKVSGSKYLSIGSKNGKITVKKNTKKGTYSIKIKVTASPNGNYNGASKTVTVKVKIK